MKIKTSELTRVALNWVVAQIEGIDMTRVHVVCLAKDEWFVAIVSSSQLRLLNYSTDWAQGGPIIAREQIALTYGHAEGHYGASTYTNNSYGVAAYSNESSLEAAMRCFVTSRLGDEVDVPEEVMS